MLAIKRFMADCIGTAAGKPKRQQQQQPKSESSGGLGVALVQPEKRKKQKGPFPVCHACDKQHEDNWENCHQISDTVRANIKKLVKAGVFDGNGSDTTKTTTARKPTKKLGHSKHGLRRGRQRGRHGGQRRRIPSP